MSLSELENILNSLKEKNLRFLSIKSDDKVKLVLEDFLYVLTGLKSSDTNYDILYVDDGVVNIIEDSRYKYVIYKQQNKYNLISTEILYEPTQLLLR